MGIRGTGTSELTFNDCVVGDDDVVGKVNEGVQNSHGGVKSG